jgi:hypothetical protein
MILLLHSQEGLSEEKGSELNSSVELLESTSILVKIFRDPRPISDSSDVRLTENETALHWLVLPVYFVFFMGQISFIVFIFSTF